MHAVTLVNARPNVTYVMCVCDLALQHCDTVRPSAIAVSVAANFHNSRKEKLKADVEYSAMCESLDAT